MAASFAPAAARAAGKAVDGAVNLNTAPPEVLGLLPGIGPAKAQSILAYRKKHPFRTVDELVRIKGIGRKMVRAWRAHLAVAGPTTATAATATAATATARPGEGPPPVAAARVPPRAILCARPAAPLHLRGGAERSSARSSHGACPRPP